MRVERPKLRCLDFSSNLADGSSYGDSDGPGNADRATGNIDCQSDGTLDTAQSQGVYRLY